LSPPQTTGSTSRRTAPIPLGNKKAKPISEYPTWLIDCLEPQMSLKDRVQMWQINNPDCIPRPEEMKLFLRSVKKYRMKMKNLSKVSRTADCDVG
jgi:hypothetical protein